MICRGRDHLVDPGEVCFVRLSQIIVSCIRSPGDVTGEGTNTVRGAAVIPAVIVGWGGNQQVHPDCIESMRLAVGKIEFSVCRGPHPQQRVRIVTGDQERGIVLVDQVASVGAELERIGRRTGGQNFGWRRR